MKKRQERQRFPSSLILRKSRKGTHVGVVISFMIFVTFLVFLYIIVQPAIRTKISKQAPLDYLENDLISWVSTDLTTASVFVDLPGSSCFILENFITKTGIDENIIVIDDSGTTFNSYISGPSLIIDTGGSDLLLKVRVSKEFDPIGPPGPSGCTNVNENGYTIGLIRTDEYVFESKVGELMEEYKNNYSGVKDVLKVSSEDEFGFSFTYANDTVIKTEEVNVSISVFAKEIPIQYIDKNAGKMSGLINIRIW